ncbi:hypothetical protein LE190_05225 [Massilia oculi]|uniref:YtxH domain-containing protein n=1 Tax=Massilia hydrophila TaxID=3044279 RepID=A0ABS7Y6L9_9BURK|nr:hypothetical protein [Massilia oculi]MCA1855326.1 hypothetical protein [Massilia oculi]
MKPIPTETGTDVGYVGKWIGAVAGGALMMYLLDPERGAARRARALSALRSAGARTGASVDHVLHQAGDRLADLKDSATDALSRSADRARHDAHEAAERGADATRRLRQESGASHAAASHNSYAASPDYDRGSRAGGGLGAWLRGLGGQRSPSQTYGHAHARDGAADWHGDAPHPALVGGGMLGLLGLMRRSPAGLLVGLAALALLMQATRNRTYRVTDNIGRMKPTGSTRATEGMPAMPVTTGTPSTPQTQPEAQRHGAAPPAAPDDAAGGRYLH